MTTKRIHYVSGFALIVFVALHLFNHGWSIYGAEKHINLMNTLRLFYRNVFVESIMLGAVLIQITSGLSLFKANRKIAFSFFDKLHILTGLYLAFFLIVHVCAVLSGRIIFQLDTNLYFGAAGLNSFPHSLFFIPYYMLAIISFFGHLASIHSKKMKRSILGLTPRVQSIVILINGCLLSIFILYGLTSRFKGLTIPIEYQFLIGK